MSKELKEIDGKVAYTSSTGFVIDHDIRDDTIIINDEELYDKSVGYAKDNDGALLTDYPMEVFGDMVLLENNTKTASPNKLRTYGDFEFHSEKEDHGQLGGWTVVAVGPLVTRVKKGDMVGNPIGNSVTVVQHPLIALRKTVKDRNGNEVLATKEELDYVYTLVNHQLIGLKYH